MKLVDLEKLKKLILEHEDTEKEGPVYHFHFFEEELDKLFKQAQEENNEKFIE